MQVGSIYIDVDNVYNFMQDSTTKSYHLIDKE